jgi:hypothetical protein
MRDGQPLGGQPARRHQLPAAPPVPFEPEEAIPRRLRAADRPAGDEIDMAVLIDVPHGEAGGGDVQDLQPL